MPRYFCAQTRQPIILQQQLASSGEGTVWTTANPKQLAKIYHHPTPQRQDKLQAMLQYGPQLSQLNHGFPATAWPQSLLMDNARQIVGFLMPRIAGGRELIDLYNPSRRKRLGIKVTWHFLHVVAHNIVSVIAKLHDQGLILGDIKPQNILVNNQAVPAIIDTDSFQIAHLTTGEIYPCLVGSEGFTPPELLGQDFAHITQTVAHDNFRLGVIIYYLLFGSHPFQGQWTGPGDPPDQQQLIKQGHWVFSQDSVLKPSKLTIPLGIIYPPLQVCFWRCFQIGHVNPRLRPSAQEWQTVLGEALRELKQCLTVQSHIYHPHTPHCYWCDRQKRLKTDIFDHSVVPAAPRQAPPPKTPPPQVAVAAVPPAPFRSTPPRRPVFHQPPPVNRLSWVSTLSLFLGGGAIASWIFSAWFLATQPSQRFLHRQSLAPIRETELSSRPPIVPSPPTAETLLKAGYSKYIQSDFAEALQKVNQSLMINPNFAEAYYYRSLVQKSLGNHQAAELDWQLAQRLAPKQMPFNPMFTSLDLALPLDVVGKSPSLPPPKVMSRREAPTAKPTSTSASSYPMPLPSVPLPGDVDAFLELEMKQINQDMLRLKSKINQEPPLPAPKNLPPL